MAFKEHPFPVGLKFPVDIERDREIIEEHMYNELYELLTDPAVAGNWSDHDREQILITFTVGRKLPRKDSFIIPLIARICREP